MSDYFDDVPVGIDLGTTNSCIGYWNGKEVKIIPNRIGEKTTPSTIYFLNDKEEYLVGEQSQKYLSLNCQKIYSIKRIIGRDFNDKDLEKELKYLHYEIIKDRKTNTPLISIKQNEKKNNYTPEQLSSLILKKLVNDAEKLLSRPIEKVVISVPAYFDDAQRNATIEAAELANLEVIRIINEPTAAGLSYGLGQDFCPLKKESPCFSNLFRKNRESRKNKPSTFGKNSFCLIEENKIKESDKNIMVFDLGGGTYDLAILQINSEHKEYEVKSKISDKFLGGNDFDNKLVDYCLNNSGLERNNPEISKKALERLRNACEQAKRKLSSREDITIHVNNIIKDRDILIKINRKKFENDICEDLFAKLELPFQELLKGAQLKNGDIDEIILVGGSTRMPKIKTILSKHFDCPINEDINPEEVVAYGATIQAAMLLTVGQNNLLKGVNLLDITPISLGTDVINLSKDPKIRELGSKMSVIIPKWTKIPVSKRKGYKTTTDNQESMQICIFEGENDYLKYNKLLGVFTLSNLPKRPKGQVQCNITFEINKNNILNVTATEATKGIKEKREIKVEASNKIKRKQKPIGEISMSQFAEEKNILDRYDFDVEKCMNNYVEAKEITEKIKILENYNKIIKESIKEINEKENEEGINEDNVETYFFYVYQLFESYEEILHLNMDENTKIKKIQYILEDVEKYIIIFRMQNIYYIKQFIELFENIDNDLFLQILLSSFHQFNEMGQYYLFNKKKFSRYYSRLYFEEVINLSKKYKNVLEKEGINDIEIMNQLKEEIQKSEIKLSEINSNAICLINKSKEEKKLIEPEVPSAEELQSKETGFTYLKNKVTFENKYLNYDEYNLIIDELEKINSELELSISKSKNNRKLQNDLFEQQGICLASIVKIKYACLNGQKYSDYIKILKLCIFDAKNCNKDKDSIKWYKSALELYKEIEEKLKNENKNIKDNTNEEIEKINFYYNKNDKMDFINYILEKWPYDGYDKTNRSLDYDWKSINKELITFLSKKYHPDLYPTKSLEEKIKNKIMENICEKLNEMIQNMTPGNSGVYEGKQYIL